MSEREQSERERFEDFFRQFCEKDILAAAREGKQSVVVDFAELDKFDPHLADKLLNDPFAIIPEAEVALENMDLPEGRINLFPRFKNLPPQSFVRIRNLRARHIGKLLYIDGVVRRASEVKPEIAVAVFECPDCGNKMRVEQAERTLQTPVFCDALECGRKAKFNLVDKELVDSRWIVLEEPFETSTGDRPGEINVFLKGDLTTPAMQRKCDPGNRVKVVGIVKEVKKLSKGRLKVQMDMFVEANHVESTDIEWEEVEIDAEDEKNIKDMASDPQIFRKLRDSLAPSIYGLEKVKEAIVLQLFGGVKRTFPDNTTIRGDIHVLLLGDPSVAKSQLLKLVSKIIPRGKYASGGGVTGPGMTATVFKDEEFTGGWVLEAGALILSHKGIFCLDEFDKIHREDMARLHEGMEQQTISIAKASIVATLPAEVSILAGANPKFSRFDQYKPIAEQINIPDTLLSRFDLKFALRDVPNRETDAKLAKHVMSARLHPESVMPEIDPAFFRKYIAYARKHCKPEMTQEAIEKLRDFYINMRGEYEETAGAVPITLRQNEALFRLAEASAKIRLGDKVNTEDAEKAISVMLESMKQLGYDESIGKFDVDKSEGMPASQRTKISGMLDIISELEKALGKEVPRDEIMVAAQERGIEEKDALELIERLKREGMVFEPRFGFIRRV